MHEGQGGTTDVTNARTWYYFRSLLDRLPLQMSTSDLQHGTQRKRNYQIRAYDFGMQFSFEWKETDCFVLSFFLSLQCIPLRSHPVPMHPIIHPIVLRVTYKAYLFPQSHVHVFYVDDVCDEIDDGDEVDLPLPQGRKGRPVQNRDQYKSAFLRSLQCVRMHARFGAL